VGDARGWAQGLLRVTNIIVGFDAGSTNGVFKSAEGKSGTTPDNNPNVVHDASVRNGAAAVSFTDSFVLNEWRTDIGVYLGNEDGTVRIGAAFPLGNDDKPNFVLRFARPF
jgi:hypothetical protein